MPSKTTHFAASDDDPLTRAIAPPPDESPQDRDARILAEREAKRISDAIDEELNRQRLAEKKAQKPVKVLLLGQSESGKSTTLKNFQLMNSSKAFRAEKASWRAVIQLNVVRSFRLILDTIADAQSNPHIDDSSSPPPEISPDHLRLKQRLSPLFRIEQILLRRLNLSSQGSAVVETTVHLTPAPNNSNGSSTTNNGNNNSNGIPAEVSVNSTVPWKGAFSRLLKSDGRRNSDAEFDPPVDVNDPNDPRVVLNSCSQDMIRLWNDPTIAAILRARKIRLEDMPGFFLDCLDRVTSLKYVPSDDDILRARLKTLGVSEHRFVMKTQAGNSLSRDWRVFDVGGHRSLRAAWVPYFDDMDAIIFLAPISCFDQVLQEDESVNRLEDSVLLWKAIVSNPLLKNTNLVLFLNKCDILKDKLTAGIRLADYILSYADRLNDFETASNYLKKKFASIHKDYSPVKRVFYCHFTSVTDTVSTMKILTSVQDMLLRQHLKDVALIS